MALTAALLGWLSVAPQIVVYTMGPGEHVFERFGHAAICVEHPGVPGGTCYNYGTTDFQTPAGEIGWDVLRGQSVFWVSTAPRERMLAAYIRADRDVFRQPLPLQGEQARALAAALADSATEARRYYIYHHFDDNCSTRVRDLIEAHTGVTLGGPRPPAARGAVTTPAEPVTTPAEPAPTRRALVLSALGELPEAALSVQLFGGRRLDEPLTPREALFLPEQLRESLSAELGARAEPVHQRRGQPFRTEAPTTWPYLLSLGALLSAPLILARRARWLRGVAWVLVPLVLGGLGALLWLVALVARVPELQLNEALLVFWPTDWALLWLSRHPGGRAASYARLRVMSLLVVLALGLVGVLMQPLAWLVWVALAPLALICFGQARVAERPAHPAQAPEIPGG